MCELTQSGTARVHIHTKVNAVQKEGKVEIMNSYMHSGEYKIKNEATTNKELKNDKLTVCEENKKYIPGHVDTSF
jgi:cytoskeletal protein CcmA (bactofilin family)